MQFKKLVAIGAVVGAAGAAIVAYAQSVSDGPAPGLPTGDRGTNTAALTDLEKGGAVAAAWVAPTAKWSQTVICALDRPSQVQHYSVTCEGASRLDAQIADCCIPGDHWETKVKNWDRAPNAGVATSPGPGNVFGVSSRVYNYGGTPEHPYSINAEVDCSYLHGVDVFPAGSFIVLSSDGFCRVTDLGLRDEIHRTP